jgi:hypothetical protein
MALVEQGSDVTGIDVVPESIELSGQGCDS